MKKNPIIPRHLYQQLHYRGVCHPEVPLSQETEQGMRASSGHEVSPTTIVRWGK